MDDIEQFERALQELGALMDDLGDLSSSVVLIGGQVIALEARRRGQSGAIAFTTGTGEELTRGFTFEPDLLFDIDGTEFMAARLPQILNLRGYQRVRQHSWHKQLDGLLFRIDLFAPPGAEEGDLPVYMTPLPDARLVSKGARSATFDIQGVSLRIRMPDAAGVLAMKTRARLQRNPKSDKDSFDIVSYVQSVGADAVLDALVQAGPEGREVRRRLKELFSTTTSEGTHEVLVYASTLEPEQRALLAQSIVDLFAKF